MDKIYVSQKKDIYRRDCNVISSYPTFNDGKAQFTTIRLNLNLINFKDNLVFLALKVFKSDNVSNASYMQEMPISLLKMTIAVIKNIIFNI